MAFSDKVGSESKGFQTGLKPFEELSLRPHMTDNEIALFGEAIKDAGSFLEFGCGGSTVLAAHVGVRRIVSVDSDRAWLAKVGQAPEVLRAEFVSHFVDIGPTGHWGTPTDPAHAPKWHKYYVDVWDRYREPYDIIFVDGRFRVACALYSLIQMRPGATMIIHDFWSRPEYHCVLRYLECTQRVDDLAVFKALPAFDHTALIRDFACYAVNAH